MTTDYTACPHGDWDEHRAMLGAGGAIADLVPDWRVDDPEGCIRHLYAEVERLREALDGIEGMDTDYAVGSDENLNRARDIALAALHPEGWTP